MVLVETVVTWRSAVVAGAAPRVYCVVLLDVWMSAGQDLLELM